MAVVFTTFPFASVIEMLTVSPGATSVVVPESSAVLAALSIPLMVTSRAPVVISRVLSAESETGTPSAPVAVA